MGGFMKKNILKLLILIFTIALLFSCTANKAETGKSEEEKIKETIDLVLSYDKGYDEKVSKHISEKTFMFAIMLNSIVYILVNLKWKSTKVK